MKISKKHTISALVALVIATLFLVLWKDEPKKQFYHNEGSVFGTYYNIRYEASKDLKDSVVASFAAFDKSLSMFNPYSTLSAINANRDTVTDAAFEAMWAEAERVHALSDGAFDITVAPLVKAFGFGKKSDQYAEISSQTIDSLREFVGFEKVELRDHRVIKQDPRVQLDGGAVAKGQACDMIADLLARNGCTNYLVDIGGEVVCHGMNPRDLNNEGAQQDLQEVLAVSDVCMATSGNYRNFYYAGDERRSHTIDPRTGYPVQHSLLSATVISSTCMRADALATACMVLGAEEGMDMIARAGDAACYFIVAQNDSLITISSPNWEEQIKE